MAMNSFGFLLLLFLGFLCVVAVPARNGPRTPVVMIPGDGGSQFFAKITGKKELVHYFCANYTEEYFSLWLDLELLAPYVLDCTVDNLRLVYDPKTKKTTNSPGVDIVTPEFGDTSGVEWLDPSQLSVSSYFAPLAVALRAEGYVSKKDMWGAPYDFRKAPDELKEFYANLTRIFEMSYKINGRPAMAVAHSLGNMVFTYFMHTKAQIWKDKYVAGYVALSAPLGGAAKLFRLYASGDTLGERFISAISVRPMQRTFPSSAFLLPYSTPNFWPADYPFVITPRRNYTAMDIPQFAKDIGFPYLYDMRENTKNLVDIAKMHPGVPVYCIHGWNVSTPEQFTYTGSMFPDTSPYVKYGQGDGTVNGISLMGCNLWNNSNWKFEHRLVPEGGEHLSILSNIKFIQYVMSKL